MVTRRDIHILVDEVPEDKLPELKSYAAFLRSGAPDMLTWVLENAPEDDEPLTAEDEQAIAESIEEYRVEGGVPAANAKRLLLG